MALDIGQPLNSVDGLKYLWLNWTIVGINPPASKHLFLRILYYIYSMIFNFLTSFCLPASTIINLWFINSWQELVGNLSLSTTISIALFKQLAVLIHHQHLLKSHEFLKPLDERNSLHLQDRVNIWKAARSCQFYYMFYIGIYACCAWGFAGIAWANHQLVYSGWFPNIFNSPQANYVAAFWYQNMAQTCLVLQNGNNDVYPICYLTLMIANLETLANRIERIGKEEKRHMFEENIEELRLCVMDHKNLLSYFDGVRPVISATLFLQFVITGFSLCMTAINLIAFDNDISQQIVAFIYIIVLLIQVFPTCWHVNLLMEKSDYLTTALYNCNWVDQNLKFRKMLIIFMQRSQKNNTVLAGDLAPVTLQTFMAIIRFSFSMFTVFSKM